MLEDWVHGDCQPDLTLLFDVPPAVSRARLAKAQDEGRALDKFEREAAAFFDRVRGAYLERAGADVRRFRIVDSTQPMAAVRAALATHVDALAAPVDAARAQGDASAAEGDAQGADGNAQGAERNALRVEGNAPKGIGGGG